MKLKTFYLRIIIIFYLNFLTELFYKYIIKYFGFDLYKFNKYKYWIILLFRSC